MQLAEHACTRVLTNEVARHTIIDAKTNHQGTHGVAALNDCFALIDGVRQVKRLHLVGNGNVRKG
jgi:hypothetical protein